MPDGLLNYLISLLRNDTPLLPDVSIDQWYDFIESLEPHYVTPYLYKRIQSLDPALWPPKGILESMKNTYLHNLKRSINAEIKTKNILKVFNEQGIDVLVVDYFKGKGDGDAFASYQELGKLVDTVKNQICGDMNIAGIGAAQATSTGKVADSAKIGRNASTIAVIQDKTQEEIEADGPECGNKKLRVVLNRNGPQMGANEYIDLNFNGNLISYKEAKQHVVQTPY
jgi:hypothetical protein